jgi:hypothetical protein
MTRLIKTWEVLKRLVEVLLKKLKERLTDWTICNQSLSEIAWNTIKPIPILEEKFVHREQKKEKQIESRRLERGKPENIQKKAPRSNPWHLLPLVSKFEINKQNLGVKNLLLELYGLDSNVRSNEPSNKTINFDEMVTYEINRHSESGKINKSFQYKYEYMEYLRNDEEIWTYYEKLLSSDADLFWINLLNWKRGWYKELSLIQLNKICKDYYECIRKLQEEVTGVREVWIEDGKKWRVLAIANPGVRLFLSGFNKFLMYYFDNILDRKIYHGFMAHRGVTSYWKTIFEENLLESEIIIELDFSACFNNIRKGPLIDSLITKYRIPKKFVQLIVAWINAPIIQKPIYELPSLDGQIERFMNLDFNLKERNLIQGLPINPLLCNVAVKNLFENLFKEFNLNKKEFKYLTYADDLSFYLTRKEFEKIGGRNFITKLNESKSFKLHGFQIDKNKSGIVKEGEYKKDLKLLGLSFNKDNQELKSITRGRLENKIKQIKARESTSMTFAFHKVGEQFYEELSPEGKKNLDYYFPQHKEIQVLNYSTVMENKMLKKYFNTLISYLFKGASKIKQNFSLENNSLRGSILEKVIGQRKIKSLLKNQEISIFCISHYLLEDLIEIFWNPIEKLDHNLIVYSHKKLLKKEKYYEENKKIEKALIDMRKLKLFLKYNQHGLINYEGVEIKINYGNLDLYYKKSKSLTAHAKELVLKELKIFMDNERLRQRAKNETPSPCIKN